MENKRRIWLAQVPIILLWALAFVIAERGDDGNLSTRWLRNGVYPALRRMEGFYTDLKFRVRGARPVQQKIVIVEIDDRAVGELGRWPWHRDAVAGIVQQAAEAGAKAIGLDIVFPEDDVRVPEGVADLMRQHQLGDEVPKFETDLVLQRIVDVQRDKLVLGWMSDHWCQPAYDDFCDVASAEALAKLPKGFEKFAISKLATAHPFDAAHSVLAAAPDVVGNIAGYQASAIHSGYLVDAAGDPDGVVRRARAIMFVGDRAHASLPLEMARLGTSDEIDVALDTRQRVARLGFAKSGRQIAVDPTGAMSINFRGGGYHFPFVGAIDLLGEDDVIPVQHDGKIENKPRKEIFGDAYVLVGVTAIGARDLRHFPTGTLVPGTEGLATILDNVLSGDLLVRSRGAFDWRVLLALMTVGALLFGLAMLRLEALPALLVSAAVIGALALVDMFWVFGRRNVDLDTIFLFGELSTLFVATLAIKYVLEERGKKFIRGTFSKYLAPAVVDEMLKDPTKLSLGGQTKRLTIMMSDLRGFTAMAERLKPEEVLSVLNHYLGTMADIIIEHNGTIDEFIGDAILVIFGAPLSGADDARRAVACACAMQRAMKAINERNAALNLPKLEMGIALNTGEVIVGNIGSQKHIKYGVVGSHVNLTARIESNTVGGQVLISGTTLELAGADIKIGEKQMIVAKGFPQPIPAYEILGIGGEYNLFLEELDLGLEDLTQPLEVRFRIMKSKNEEGEEQAARVRSLSLLGATLETSQPLEAFKNIKIAVSDREGKPVAGDLYAKVTKSGAICTLRFTAVPPAVGAFFKAELEPLGPQRSSELATKE